MCTTILIHCTTLFYDLTNIHMHGRRIKGGGGEKSQRRDSYICAFQHVYALLVLIDCETSYHLRRMALVRRSYDAVINCFFPFR